MNCIEKTQINHGKPIAIIGFSKHEIRERIKQFELQNLFSATCWENWNFDEKSLAHFQTDKKNHLFLYLANKKFEAKLFLKAVDAITNEANDYQLTNLQMVLAESSTYLLPGIAKQLFLADYTFDNYKQKKKLRFLKEIVLVSKSANEEEFLAESKTIAEATKLARDLVNEPSNVIHPETLAEQCVKLGKEAGFKATVLTEEEIEDLQMHAFLAVAKGSKKPPRLIVLKYAGNDDEPHQILGLVGKGLTYDSGGYSIKSTEGMFNMKADMAGAASVIAAMYAIAKQKLKCNVTTVIAACENMISGNSYKPGDVISSMSGKTIEIGNTDAEGRLTLIDAIYYAIQEQKVTKVVDVATLTGAVVVALGMVRTGVISNHDSFYQDLENASQISLERFWRLPHDEEYKELLKSEVADISNTGGKMAGSITAGLFIQSFLPKDIPWLHLDIAGTSFLPKKSSRKMQGATGVPVSTLYYLIKNSSKKK